MRQPDHVSANLDAAMRVYAEKLTEFPAAAVQQTLADWPARSSYWPTWRELEDALSAGNQARKDVAAIMRSLQELEG